MQTAQTEQLSVPLPASNQTSEPQHAVESTGLGRSIDRARRDSVSIDSFLSKHAQSIAGASGGLKPKSGTIRILSEAHEVGENDVVSHSLGSIPTPKSVTRSTSPERLRRESISMDALLRQLAGEGPVIPTSNLPDPRQNPFERQYTQTLHATFPSEEQSHRLELGQAPAHAPDVSVTATNDTLSAQQVASSAAMEAVAAAVAAVPPTSNNEKALSQGAPPASTAADAASIGANEPSLDSPQVSVEEGMYRQLSSQRYLGTELSTSAVEEPSADGKPPLVEGSGDVIIDEGEGSDENRGREREKRRKDKARRKEKKDKKEKKEKKDRRSRSRDASTDSMGEKAKEDIPLLDADGNEIDPSTLSKKERKKLRKEARERSRNDLLEDASPAPALAAETGSVEVLTQVADGGNHEDPLDELVDGALGLNADSAPKAGDGGGGLPGSIANGEVEKERGRTDRRLSKEERREARKLKRKNSKNRDMSTDASVASEMSAATDVTTDGERVEGQGDDAERERKRAERKQRRKEKKEAKAAKKAAKKAAQKSAALGGGDTGGEDSTTDMTLGVQPPRSHPATPNASFSASTVIDAWRLRVEELSRDHLRNTLYLILRGINLYAFAEEKAAERLQRNADDPTLMTLRMLRGRLRLARAGKDMKEPSTRQAKIDVATGLKEVLDKDLEAFHNLKEVLRACEDDGSFQAAEESLCEGFIIFLVGTDGFWNAGSADGEFTPPADFEG